MYIDGFKILQEKSKVQRKVEKQLVDLILKILKNNALSNKEIYEILKQELKTKIKVGNIEIEYIPIDIYQITNLTKELQRKDILKKTEIFKTSQKTPIKKLYSVK